LNKIPSFSIYMLKFVSISIPVAKDCQPIF
jgi:hypothetical protein